MRTIRTLTGLVSLGLMGLAPVALAAAPAQAATAYNTSTMITTQPSVVEYGTTVSVSGNVAAADAAGQSGVVGSTGTTTLQVISPGKSWTTVATQAGGSFYFTDVKPAANSQYKVVYSGGASATGDTFAPSESTPLTIGVQRKVKVSIKSTKLTLVVKVKPDFKKKKVKVQIKKNGNYKTFKKVKSNKKGKATIKLPGKKGGGTLYFRVIVPGDAKFVGWQDEYYTTVS